MQIGRVDAEGLDEGRVEIRGNQLLNLLLLLLLLLLLKQQILLYLLLLLRVLLRELGGVI